MMVGVVAIVVCVVMFYGSYSISSSFYLKSLCRGRGSSQSVAITFDDGVDPLMTPKVLEVLRRHDAKATFFIIGEKAHRHPEIVKQIVDQGHTIGNHSYYHQGYFPIKSTREICKEIDMCNQAIKSATGLEVKLFRPPFGVTNPMVGRAVRQSKLTSIGWSIRSLDTMGGGIERISGRVTSKLKAGSVVLLHDNLEGADSLLDTILTQMREKGLSAVTINKLFELK